MVLNQAVRAIGLMDEANAGHTWDESTLSIMQMLGGESPFEVQVSGL
jgi:hypothetical protein